MTQPTMTKPGNLLETLLVEWQKAIIGKPVWHCVPKSAY